MRTYVILILATAAIALVLFFVMRRGPEDPEEQVRRTLEEAVKEVEARDLGALMDHVSERFKARSMDKRSLKGFMFMQLRRGDWRRVFLVDTQIEIGASQQTAQVETGAVLATGENIERLEDVVPTDAGSYRFDIQMELEEDDWRVVTVEYERTVLPAAPIPGL